MFGHNRKRGFRVSNIFDMTKENPSQNVAQFIENIKFEGKELMSHTQEIINLFMETEQANDLLAREKALRCLYTIKQLHKAVFNE